MRPARTTGILALRLGCLVDGLPSSSCSSRWRSTASSRRVARAHPAEDDRPHFESRPFRRAVDKLRETIHKARSPRTGGEPDGSHSHRMKDDRARRSACDVRHDACGAVNGPRGDKPRRRRVPCRPRCGSVKSSDLARQRAVSSTGVSLDIDIEDVAEVLLADGWHVVHGKSFELDAFDFTLAGRRVHGGGDSGVCATGFSFVTDQEGSRSPVRSRRYSRSATVYRTLTACRPGDVL